MDHLEGLEILGRVALLQTGLKNHVVAANRLGHGSGLANGERDGLLAIDVLAGLGGAHGDGRVPTLAGHHGHSVDVVASEQFAEVVVRLETMKLAARLLGAVDLIENVGVVLPSPRIDVAEGQKLHVGVVGEDAEVAASHAAHADRADRDPVAGRRGPVEAQHV